MALCVSFYSLIATLLLLREAAAVKAVERCFLVIAGSGSAQTSVTMAISLH